MIADWAFYQNNYHGIIIASETDYGYFAERASDELAPYADSIPQVGDAEVVLKKCACRIADILYGGFKSSKNGQAINSESVSGYYSVSYSANDAETINKNINNAIRTYIGKYLVRPIKVIR